MRDSSDVVTCFDLLSNERTSRSEEENLSTWVPAVEVEPMDRNRISSTAGQAKERGTHMTQAAMKVFPNPVGKLTRVFL